MPKTDAGTREIILPQSAKKVLRAIRQASPCPFGEWLFCYADGSRIKSKAIRYALKTACEAVGIPVRTPHKIRKTYASGLIASGMAEATIQAQLGHADISTTRKYYDFDLMDRQEKIEAIDRAVTANV